MLLKNEFHLKPYSTFELCQSEINVMINKFVNLTSFKVWIIQQYPECSQDTE